MTLYYEISINETYFSFNFQATIIPWHGDATATMVVEVNVTQERIKIIKLIRRFLFYLLENFEHFQCPNADASSKDCQTYGSRPGKVNDEIKKGSNFLS